MAIKHYKSITPGQRNKSIVDGKLGFVVLRDGPEKSLTKGVKRKSARDSQGRISVRRRGGGSKKKYREIDFRRNLHDVEGLVKTIEYDPNRTAFISLIVYTNGEKRYVLTTENMKVDSKIISGEFVKSVEGNHLPLMNVNVGAFYS